MTRSSLPEPRFTTDCVERFLRYVTYDTTSDEASSTYPSTEKQLRLLSLLAEELRGMGLEEVAMDRHGYVTARVPATSQKCAESDGQAPPVIAFIAHVDTSPAMSGTGVKPLVHANYDGGELRLPDDPAAILSPTQDPDLAAAVGDDIITASGTTLLGADDKAGVAEIMAAARYLLDHPEIARGEVRLLFTPDEEVGRGTLHLDVEALGADYGYTLDGGGGGVLETETFSADTQVFAFQGFNTHPGYAKGKMVNAIKVAADFLARFPKDRLSPETTDGYEGYVHPTSLEASEDRTVVRVLIRDFQDSGLVEKEAFLDQLARGTVADWPGSSVEVSVEQTYRNMSQILDHHPEVVEVAEEAFRRTGQNPSQRPIRGGTDGSKLSFMGLPTPNLSSGQHGIHSRLEWASVREMHKAVEVLVEIVKLFEERA